MMLGNGYRTIKEEDLFLGQVVYDFIDKEIGILIKIEKHHGYDSIDEYGNGSCWYEYKFKWIHGYSSINKFYLFNSGYAVFV